MSFTARLEMKICAFRRPTKDYREIATAIDAGEASLRISQKDSSTHVAVTGRVTVDSSPFLRSVLFEVLRRGSNRVVVVDLSGVSYLDISGVATLLEALKMAREGAVVMRLTGVKGQPRMLAEVVELDKVFRSSGSEVEFQ